MNSPAIGWLQCHQGYDVDTTTGSNGTRSSLRCANTSTTDKRGGYQRVVLNQTAPAPFFVKGVSKASNVSGSPNAGYSLYVNVYYKDGSRLNAYRVPFSTGTHNWEYQALPISPTKAVSYILIYCMFKGHSGTAWFDNIYCALGTGEGNLGPNLLANMSFEATQDGGADSWKPYNSGYGMDNAVHHGGAYSIRCTNAAATDSRGASQYVALNQTTPIPILITGWSKASNTSTTTSRGDYTLYVGLTYTDGTTGTWYTPYTAGTHDWESQQILISPAKPIDHVVAYGMFRNRTGTVWFDDFSITQLPNSLVFDTQQIGIPQLPQGAKWGWFARDVAANSDVQLLLTDTGASGPGLSQLHLQMQNVQADPSGQILSGRLLDTTGQPRAVTLYYVERFEDTNLIWGNSLRQPQSVGGGDSVNQIKVGLGATGFMSQYPFGCVAGDTAGRAVGVPAWQGPRITRLGYNSAARALYVGFDLALTSANLANSDGSGHGTADVAVVRYDIDRRWGFRSAAARYYQMFPEAYDRHGAPDGTWLYYTNPQTIQSPADFGFGYHTGRTSAPVDYRGDDALGIRSILYNTASPYYTPLPKGSWTYDSALAQILQQANSSSEFDRNWARAILNSGSYDANGKLNVFFEAFPWSPGAVWLPNPSPYLPYTATQPTKASLTYTKALADATYAPSVSGVPDGEFLDNIEVYGSVLDFRANSLKYSHVPLTFTTDTHQPTLPMWFSEYELTELMSQDLHGRGKILQANGPPRYSYWFFPLVDVMGIEVDWNPGGVWKPESDDLMSRRRTLSGKKPYLLQMQTDWNLFTSAQMNKYLQRSLFYGILPSASALGGSGTSYFEVPTLYNRDRSLWKKYIPIIKLLSAAGWEPVTNATSSNQAVYLERFGQSYLTVFNDSAGMAAATVTIDLASRGLAGAGKTVRLTDLITGQVVGPVAANATISVPVSLNPEQALALKITN